MTSLYFVFVNVVLYEIYREKAEVTINYVVKSYKEEVNAKQNVQPFIYNKTTQFYTLNKLFVLVNNHVIEYISLKFKKKIKK